MAMTEKKELGVGSWVIGSEGTSGRSEPNPKSQPAKSPSAPSWWRVVFSETGAITAVTPVRFDDAEEGWLLVEAPSKSAARQKAQRLYDARKKKLAKARLHASGHCACGRVQDRKYPDGRPMKTCSTCSERQKGYVQDRQERLAEGTADTHVRDERARVEANLGRQRARRAELRLETLIEVRQAWRDARTVGRFAAWIEAEIFAITDGRRESAA